MPYASKAKKREHNERWIAENYERFLMLKRRSARKRAAEREREAQR